jgi:hypothetical protein
MNDMTDGDRLVLHETLATHLPMLRLATNWASIPLETMLPIEPAEVRYFEIAATHIGHGIAHYAGIVRLLQSARKTARRQAAMVKG